MSHETVQRTGFRVRVDSRQKTLQDIYRAYQVELVEGDLVVSPETLGPEERGQYELIALRLRLIPFHFSIRNLTGMLADHVEVELKVPPVCKLHTDYPVQAGAERGTGVQIRELPGRFLLHGERRLCREFFFLEVLRSGDIRLDVKIRAENMAEQEFALPLMVRMLRRKFTADDILALHQFHEPDRFRDFCARLLPTIVVEGEEEVR